MPQSGHWDGWYTTFKLTCFGNKLNEEVCRGFIFTNLFNSFANLATNFQDLVIKKKNLIVLAPALGAISRLAILFCGIIFWAEIFMLSSPLHQQSIYKPFCSENYNPTPYDVPFTPYPSLPAAPSSPVSTCIFYQRNTQQAKSLKIIWINKQLKLKFIFPRLLLWLEEWHLKNNRDF